MILESDSSCVLFFVELSTLRTRSRTNTITVVTVLVTWLFVTAVLIYSAHWVTLRLGLSEFPDRLPVPSLPMVELLDGSGRHRMCNMTAPLSAFRSLASDAPSVRTLAACSLYQSMSGYAAIAAGRMLPPDTDPACVVAYAMHVPMPGLKWLWPRLTYIIRYTLAVTALISLLEHVITLPSHAGVQWLMHHSIFDAAVTWIGLFVYAQAYHGVSLWQDMLVDLPYWADAAVCLMWRFWGTIFVHPYFSSSQQKVHSGSRVLLAMTACVVMCESWVLLYGQSELVCIL